MAARAVFSINFRTRRREIRFGQEYLGQENQAAKWGKK
jgi:hypothetical protein